MSKGDFESNLEAAGSFGKAQWILVFMNLYIMGYSGWQTYIPVFSTRKVDFYCIDSRNNSKVNLVDLYSNLQTMKLSEVFESNGSEFDQICVDHCSQYVYKSKPDSIVSEFNLACGSDTFLVAFSNSIYFIACFISCFVSGYLCDKYGRKNVAFFLIIIQCLSTTGIIFTHNIYLYIGLRFVAGFGTLTTSIDYIIFAESADKKILSKMGLTIMISFVLGEFSCILCGYFLQGSWHLQFAVLAVPGYVYAVLHFFFMPESARWLHSQKKYARAEEVLKKIAKINNRDPLTIHLYDTDENLANNFQNSETSSSTQNLIEATSDESDSDVRLPTTPSLLDLFKTVPSALLTLSGALSWFSASLVYYGLTYDVQNIGGDFYLNAILLTFTEIPAWFVCLAMDKFGRLRTFYISLFICSIACAILPFTAPLLNGNLQIAFAVLGKFLSTGAFDSLYVYTPEQLPTVLRTTGITFCSAAARIASICAPFIIEIKAGPYNSVPFIIFAVSGLITCISVFLVGVETKDKPYITTIEEYQQLAHTKEVKQIQNKVEAPLSGA